MPDPYPYPPPILEPPFAKEHQLNADLDLPPPPPPPPRHPHPIDPNAAPPPPRHHHLPGHPRIPLHRGGGGAELWRFLTREFCSADLDAVAPRLWWMSKQDSGNISALTRQAVKRRQVVVTEEPKLHLVWIHDRIFVKPLPRYLLSHAFWTEHLLAAAAAAAAAPSEEGEGEEEDDDGRRAAESRVVRVQRAALGFLRTYDYLVQHESDFRLAQAAPLCLVPADVSWERFCAFAAGLRAVPDAAVSLRYHYGEIRLTRLNFYAKFLLRKWHYQRMNAQYGEYFARFYGPLLFGFAVVSTLLSAMQVELGVEQVGALRGWRRGFGGVSRWFSVVSLLGCVALALGLLALFLYKVAGEWNFALRDRRGIRRAATVRVATTVREQDAEGEKSAEAYV